MDRRAEIGALNKSIRRLEKRGRLTRYPTPLRSRILKFVDGSRAVGISLAQSCREPGLQGKTVECWSERRGSKLSRAAFRHVTIVQPPAPAFVVRGPFGIVVQGMVVEQLPELLRRLG
jgi:hypothetical protein